MKINLLGQSGQSRSDDVLSQLTQNWYLSLEREGKSQQVLYPTPGLTEFSDFSSVNNFGVRGSIEYGDTLYVVVGNKFYEVSSTGSFLERGSLNTSSGRVNIAHNGPDNGQQIMLVDGTNGYIYNSSTTTLSVISDADYPDTATHVVFMDGYFIVNNPQVTGQFHISSSYDGAAWDATDIATVERNPDPLKALIVSNRLLWLVGSKTAEKWFNAGNLDFPFEADQSGFSQWGIAAPNSLVEVSGLTFWISNNEEGNGLIISTSGGNPQVISSQEIATEISKISDISDAYAYTYQYQQHPMVVFTFPTGQKSFVYDILTQKWHTWSSKTLGYHRSYTHTFVYGKHIVGDPVQGKLYYLDWSNYTDNGDQITRIRRSVNIHAEDKAIRHHGVWLDVKEGVGDTTTPDPQIRLRWRDNNGAWSNYHSRSMGQQGERNKKVVWRKLGRSRDRVYEISVADPINAVIVDAFARLDIDARELG